VRRPGHEDEVKDAAHQSGQDDQVGEVLPLVRDGGAGQQPLQLGEGHHAAGEGQAAQHHLEADGGHLHRAEARVPAIGVVLGHADQRHGGRPEGVRQRRPLRHRRHGRPPGDEHPGRGPQEQAHQDPLVGDHLVVQQRAHDGGQHAELGQVHPPAGRARIGQQLQAQDERHRRGEVGQLDEGGVEVQDAGRLLGHRGPFFPS
jgi:hypothetical protein